VHFYIMQSARAVRMVLDRLELGRMDQAS
jgi:hypothetical protein